MILPEDRQMAIDLINEAVTAGARQHKACEMIEINTRTLRRWKQQLLEERSLQDRRKASVVSTSSIPVNKLTDEERATIVKTCNLPEYKSLPPSCSYACR